MGCMTNSTHCSFKYRKWYLFWQVGDRRKCQQRKMQFRFKHVSMNSIISKRNFQILTTVKYNILCIVLITFFLYRGVDTSIMDTQDVILFQ